MSEDKFRLAVEEKNDIVIIKTNGYINNVAGEQIAEVCYKKMDEGKSKFLLDLENSRIVNSIGVSIIIEIIEKLQEVSGHIGYYNLAPIVAKTFKIMGLIQYSTIYETQEKALSDMQSK